MFGCKKDGFTPLEELIGISVFAAMMEDDERRCEMEEQDCYNDADCDLDEFDDFDADCDLDGFDDFDDF